MKDSIEKLFFSISEAAHEINVPVSTIRFWEKNYPELSPEKTAGGTRKYSREDILRLQILKTYTKVDGMHLDAAITKLKRRRFAGNETILAELHDLKAFLKLLKSKI